MTGGLPGTTGAAAGMRGGEVGESGNRRTDACRAVTAIDSLRWVVRCLRSGAVAGW